MAKTIVLTDQQTEEWKTLIEQELIKPGLTTDWASRLAQLLMQITNQPDPLFIVNYGRKLLNGDYDPSLRPCVVCAILDPEVKGTPNGYRCPLHMPAKERTKEEQIIYDLFQIGELAGYYMPGELAENPGKVQDTLARAQVYLESKGMITNESRLYEHGSV